MSKIKVANHHTGDFEFPMAEGDILHGHICLVAGQVTELDLSDWNKIKDNPIVKHWLEREKISIVKSKGAVPTNNLELVDLTIPPELSRPEEEGKFVKAKVIDKRVETTTDQVQAEIPESTPKKTRKPRKSTKK